VALQSGTAAIIIESARKGKSSVAAADLLSYATIKNYLMFQRTEAVLPTIGMQCSNDRRSIDCSSDK
jgi:hypothetical protein